MARRLGGCRPLPLLLACGSPTGCSQAGAQQPCRSLFGFTFGAEHPPAPSEIPARPATRRYAGQEWRDEYSWLERGGQEVQRVVQEERRYAEHWLQRCAPLAAQFHEEMLAQLPTTQVSVPERVGTQEYYVQQLPGQPHPCYMRRPVRAAGTTRGGSVGSSSSSGSSAEEVVLDVNEVAAVHGEYVQVGQMKLSLCGQRLAFTLEAGTGEESFGAFVRDLTTGTLRHLGALGGVASLEWAADGRTLLATQPNQLGRPWRVVACDVGSGTGSRVVFEEGDERFFVELGRTKDWSFLTINCNSKASSEVHLLPTGLPPGRWWGTNAASAATATTLAVPDDRSGGALSTPLQLEPRVVQPRQAGLEYFVEHNGGQLYILSNAQGAENYAVFRVPVAAPLLSQEHWQVVVPEREGTAIEDMDMTRDWLVLYQRLQGRQQVAALPLQGGLPAEGAVGAGAAQGRSGSQGAAAVVAAVGEQDSASQAAADAQPEPFTAAAGAAAALPAAHATPQPGLCVALLPGWALSVVAGANADFGSDSLRLMLSSPVHREATYDWKLGSRKLVWRSGGQQPAAAAAVEGAGQGDEREVAHGLERDKWRQLWQQQQQWQQQWQQQHCSGEAGAAGEAAGPGAAELAWRQEWATSADGTRVPLTVAFTSCSLGGLTTSGGSIGDSKVSSSSSNTRGSSSSSSGGGGSPAGPQPCLLVVYGAYGHCLPTEFLAERLPLLRRGWVLALAHVRGGGELGRRWHAAGRGAAKTKSVDDLEACLDYLVAAGLTRPGLVALEAHSAGGLTAGALLNRRPAEVGAGLLEAPFVDVLSAMCQPELPLTVHEYEEWGDPREARQWEQIRRLCPYQNVRPAAAYPPTLLTCSQQDLRVPFWGPLKHAARMRAAVVAAEAAAAATAAATATPEGESGLAGSWRMAGRHGPILLLPDGQAGHFVHERDLYATKAQQYAFLSSALEGRL